MLYVRLVDALKYAPEAHLKLKHLTVDAVQVTRCRDCINQSTCGIFKEYVKHPDFFCAAGKSEHVTELQG